MAVDLYEGQWALVQEYAPPKDIDQDMADKRVKDIMTVLPEVLQLNRSHIFLKTRRKQTGKSQYDRFAKEGKREVVYEGGWEAGSDVIDTIVGLQGTHAKQAMLRLGNAYLEFFEYVTPAGTPKDPAYGVNNHGCTH